MSPFHFQPALLAKACCHIHTRRQVAARGDPDQESCLLSYNMGEYSAHPLLGGGGGVDGFVIKYWLLLVFCFFLLKPAPR